MAKWALTSDTQFDEQLSHATINSDGLSSRLQDSINCLDWIVSTALARKCEGLIHLGDFYDSRTSIDVSVLDQTGRALFRASDEGLSLCLMVGNHDSKLRCPRINSLWPFAGVASIFDEPMVHRNFAFVPWVEDDDLFAEQVDSLVGKAEFLFAHCMIEGAVPNVSGARLMSTLQPTKWRQVILGDVHDPVQIAKNVRYCGSPMQWHYGDAGRPRGFLILDDATGKIEFIENDFSPRFHLLTEVDQGKVRKGDFVRVRTSDVTVSAEIIKSVAKAEPAYVETEAVEIENVAPRLPIHAKDPQEQVLKRWVEHVGMSEVADDLIPLGLELLEEARRG